MVQDRGPATAIVTIVFIVLATLVVGARFFTRGYLVRSFKRDDWWILAAWLVAVGFSTAICTSVHYGLGRHLEDIPVESLAGLRRSQYAFSVLYNPALMLTKTSILIFYLSIMSKDVDPVFKWCNWLTLAVVNVAGMALTFVNLFQCRPVSMGYTYAPSANAHCIDIVTLYQSSAPVNIITDLAILILPMPILTGMRLPRRQKIILLVTFSFGVFVAVVDVIRLAYLQAAALDRLTFSGSRIEETENFPWYASLSFMWSAVEVNVGIICACVPCLKPLFARFLPSFITDVPGMSVYSSFDEGAKKATPDHLSAVEANELNNPAAFHKPSGEEYVGDEDGDTMGFYNMLTNPPPTDDLTRRPTQTKSMTRVPTKATIVSDFGFVKMHLPRNMLKLTNRQSVWPVAVVTIIFFLWGFAYGLLDTLNSQFQTITEISLAQTNALHSAYYAAYFFGPLTVGRFILTRYGFKACMIAGLCIYGCGALVFWPAAVLTSYPAFVISNFIVAFGLSCLEVAANPYIALCGPSEYAEVRLNLSQGFQAIGTVVSPLLAKKALFKDVLNTPSLINVQWTYLGIAIFVWVLAVVFYYIPLPEATDEQLEEQAERQSANNHARIGPWRVIWVTLTLGVFAQWCYVGAQESVGDTAGALASSFEPTSILKAFDFVTVGHSIFAFGRFLTAFLNYLVKPRWILLVLFVGLSITTGLQTTLSGNGAVIVLMLTYLLEAGVFSITYAISLRGLGSHTRMGSSCLAAAISGGAVIPIIQWAVSNTHGVPYSYAVLAAVFGVAAAFPIYLNLTPAARKQVDPYHDIQRAKTFQWSGSSRLSIGAAIRQSAVVGHVVRYRKTKVREQHQAGGHEPDFVDGVPSFQHVECTQPTKILPTSDYSATEKHHDGIALPSPVFAKFKKFKSHQREGYSSHESVTSSDESDAVGTNTDDRPAPQPRREWTEKDDVIDDYHNVLKDI